MTVLVAVLAGTSFRGRAIMDYIDTLPDSTPLVLEADPSNTNDQLAIKVSAARGSEMVWIGYVGAQDFRGLSNNREFHRHKATWRYATLIRTRESGQYRVSIPIP